MTIILKILVLHSCPQTGDVLYPGYVCCRTSKSSMDGYYGTVITFHCSNLSIFECVFHIVISLSVIFTAALQALKRKKRYEKQLQQIDGTLSTIEFQREALENASTNTEVLKVMGVAAKALKEAHNNL